MKRVVGLIIAATMFVSAPATRGIQDTPKLRAAEARKIIADGNRKWGEARIALDRPTFEKMLAADFYVQLQNRKLTRKEFIDGISAYPPGVRLTRFEATVLTVRPTSDGGWVALIHEKLEFEQSGKKICALWITRDGWKELDNQWKILFSEEMGSEWWGPGSQPPFPDW